jgi:CHAT domain-containing protein/tetratricopeptide (TPR) repeat protein
MAYGSKLVVGLIATTLWLPAIEVSMAAGREVELPQTLAQAEGQLAEAVRLFNQAVDLQNRGQSQEAITLWRQSLQIQQAVGNLDLQWQTLVPLGMALNELGQREEAIILLQQALTVVQEVIAQRGSSQELEIQAGEILGRLGIVYREAGQYQQAVEILEERIAIAQEIGDRAGEGAGWGNLGLAYAGLEQYEQAITAYEQRLEITRELGQRNREVLNLANLSEVYVRTDRIPEAISLLQEALGIAQETGDRAQAERILDRLADLDSLSSRSSVAASEEHNLLLSDTALLLDQGLDAYDAGDFAEALQLLQQALSLLQSEAVRTNFPDISRREEARTLANIGNTYDALGNYEQAVDFQRQAIALRRQTGDQYGEALSLMNLGNTYDRMQDYESAIAAYEEALEIWQDLEDIEKTGRLLDKLGRLHTILNQYQNAIATYEESLAIKRATQNQAGEAEILRDLGIAYRRLSNYPQAIELHQQSLAVAREIQDRTQEAAALGNLGITYSALGSTEQALSWYRQALEIYQETNDLTGQSNALDSIGIAYAGMGQYQQAIESYEQALALAREANDLARESSTTNNLGSLYQTLGREEKALELYEHSLNISRELRDQAGEALALRNIATVHPNLLRRSELLSQSIEITNSLNQPAASIRAWGDLGNWYLSNPRALSISEGRPQVEIQLSEALGAYRQALTLAQQHGLRAEEATILGNLGNLYRRFSSSFSQDSIQEEIVFYEQSLAIHRQMGNQQGEGEILHNLALTYLSLRKYAEAEQYLLSSLEVLDALREGNLSDPDKLALFETQRDVYEALQRTLIDQGRVEDALVASERGRARVLVEALANRVSTAVEQDILDTVPDLAQIRRIARQQNTTLVTYSRPIRAGRLYIWVVQPTGDIAFESVALEPDAPQLEWTENEAGDFSVRSLPSTGVRLQDLVAMTRNAMGVRGERATVEVIREQNAVILAQQREASEAKLSQLYELLIGPIADLLPDDPEQAVAFIPQSELFLVPFPALRNAEGRYLIEDHTIITAPSIQVLQLTDDLADRSLSASRTEQPLIVGNPVMPQVTLLSDSGEFVPLHLAPLSGALREAEAVASFLGATALTGAQATEAQVKRQMPQADVIHLATHGLLEYGDPRETGTLDLPGAIALTPGGGDDGLLTSAEILAMDLQADLAILSACDTGRGRITGDGVIGLSRAFVAAGVPSLIVSLWAVDDDATADLMVAFYDHWQQSGNKAQALRQAMLTTMAEHPDPFLWAAFTLIGSAE